MKNNKTLGKGLASLLQDDADDNQQVYSENNFFQNITYINISDIIPSEFQPRKTFNDETIYELSQSIKQKGILSPILVRKLNNMYEIIAGERRWRAALKANLTSVPVLIKDISDQEALEIAILENLQREALTPIDEARAFYRLYLDYRYTHDDIAKAVGKSRAYITNYLRVLTLPDQIIKFIDNGDISMGHAKILAGSENPEQLLNIVLNESLSVRQLEKYASSINIDSNPKKVTNKNSIGKGSKKNNSDLIDIEKNISDYLGLKVDLQETSEGGRMVLYFNNMDQLDFIVQKLTN